MKYLMLICGPDTEDDPETVAAQMKQITAWMDAQHAAGAIAHPGYQLHPSTTARTIRSSGARAPTVTEGQFNEAQEVSGGLIGLDHDTIARATEAASEWVRNTPAVSI